MGELAVRQYTVNEIQTLAQSMAASGYFRDAKDAAQALVKIQYGQEIGVGPAQAMMQIYVVEGKPGPAAVLLAAKIKQSGRYDYRIVKHDDTGCWLDAYEKRDGKFEKVGESNFTVQDATNAKLLRKDNFQGYPRNMFFCRALSNLARWYAPDVFGGVVYTAEELEEEARGATIKVEATPVVDDRLAKRRAALNPAPDAEAPADAAPPAAPAEPLPLEAAPAPTDNDPRSDADLRELLTVMLREKNYSKAKAQALFASLAGKEKCSLADLTRPQLLAALTFSGTDPVEPAQS
jgi:hypothetical protein